MLTYQYNERFEGIASQIVHMRRILRVVKNPVHDTTPSLKLRSTTKLNCCTVITKPKLRSAICYILYREGKNDHQQ